MIKLQSSALVAFLVWTVTLWLSVPAAFAAEESCASCDKKVIFGGDFIHRRAPNRITIEGAPPGMENYYREGIFGSSFTATIPDLPEGRYTIIVGVMEAETDITDAGPRVFDISVGEQVLAKGLDIVAAAGGSNKVHFVSGTVQHLADTLAGPIVVNFHATTGTAKMNTIEVKDAATGTSVLFVRAEDLVDQADSAARQIPQVPGPVLWLDPCNRWRCGSKI